MSERIYSADTADREEWAADPTEDGPVVAAKDTYIIRTSLLRVDGEIKSFSLIFPSNYISSVTPIKLAGRNQTLFAALYGAKVLDEDERMTLFRMDPNIANLAENGENCICAGCKCDIPIKLHKQVFDIMTWQIHSAICEPLQYALNILNPHLASSGSSYGPNLY
ncbi:hypothetical protein BD410DRAFT_836521 [Rickenella mellea]|uniref:Uncharacterized protein n=1 Tax=Rickenella mellea TaxID=50990 RepID=A0A4Y7QGX6_9AGAM|nr:hypothetical protein BD410DRAFT_836521 [Rickenella mellea]